MSHAFLSNFMQVANSISGAERCLAIDSELNILDNINFSEKDLTSERVLKWIRKAVQDAIEQDDAILTNNLNPSDLPNTNVHLHDLRMIVAIPVGSYGGVYFDQHIRQGVFPRDMIDKLRDLAKYVVSNGQMALSATELIALYNSV